jgi:hypothetical protein
MGWVRHMRAEGFTVTVHPTANLVAVKAAPGMPASAPGMDQPGEPYEVVLFGTPSGEQVWARH